MTSHEFLYNSLRETRGANMVWILGLLITGVSAGTFWYLLPKNGQTHPIVTMPFLDQLVPVSFVSGFAIGITMFISAFTS